jgi:hypothetical protein
MNTNDYAHHARFALAYAITHDSITVDATPPPSPETVRQMTERFLAAFPEFPRPREPQEATLTE